jgi:hypothetical protein
MTLEMVVVYFTVYYWNSSAGSEISYEGLRMADRGLEDYHYTSMLLLSCQ